MVQIYLLVATETATLRFM